MDGVVDGPAEAELHVPPGQLVEDVAGIGQRPGEPVQLGDDRRRPSQHARRGSPDPPPDLIVQLDRLVP